MKTYLTDILVLLPVNDEIRLEIAKTINTPNNTPTYDRHEYMATPNALLEGLSPSFLMSNVDTIWIEDEILCIHSIAQ